MMRNGILAAGIVMSSASQIKVPGLPFGFGEILLFAWIGLTVVEMIVTGRAAGSPALTRLTFFWTALALLLSLGAIVGYMTTELYSEHVLHDAEAYVLVALVTCLAAADPDAPRTLRQCAWLVIAFADLTFVPQVAQGWGVLGNFGLSPWYFDRFEGWSSNPNQLALYCAAFGPLALHLAATSNNKSGKWIGLASIALIFYVGRLTKSDTYLYVSVLAVLIFSALKIRTWLTLRSGGASLARQMAVLFLMASVPLAAAAAPYAYVNIKNAEAFAKSLTKDKGGSATEETAALRVFLWTQAVETGMESASLGLGPGPHLVRRPSGRSTFIPAPFEAHNTALDLYTQGGLLSVVLLIWIVGSAGAFALRAKFDALVALIASMAVFSMPHLIIRHPLVWFVVTLCLVTGKPGTQHALLRRQR
jgi:O-Antigen ligase